MWCKELKCLHTICNTWIHRDHPCLRNHLVITLPGKWIICLHLDTRSLRRPASPQWFVSDFDRGHTSMAFAQHCSHIFGARSHESFCAGRPRTSLIFVAATCCKTMMTAGSCKLKRFSSLVQLTYASYFPSNIVSVIWTKAWQLRKIGRAHV